MLVVGALLQRGERVACLRVAVVGELGELAEILLGELGAGLCRYLLGVQRCRAGS